MGAGQEVVFVVDDEASVRKALKRLLRAAGLCVETFASAHEFLARPRYRGAGCLVLDVQMPGMTGLDLQEELIRTSNGLPIIFISAHDTALQKVRATSGHAVDFFLKPFDNRQFLASVERALTKSQSAAPSGTDGPFR